MRKTTRKQKETLEVGKPNAKEKFLEVAREESLYLQKQTTPKFEAATQNQRRALAMFKEKRSVIFLTGFAGTGKSMLASFHAACELKQKRVDKVYLVRPAVAVGKSVGLLPGEIDAKMYPYFAQTLNHLEKFMGTGFMNYCVEKKIIEMKPAEYLRGMSFENCIVIVEESQNFTKEEFEMVVTRLGNNCTIVFTGDTKQHDLKGESGLAQTLRLFEKMDNDSPDYLTSEDLDQLSSNVGIVKFTVDDVVRSGLTRAFVKIYHHNN